MELQPSFRAAPAFLFGTAGEILTNSHVVEECQSIRVKLVSGNSEQGAVIARDEWNDLAVVRLTVATNPSSVVVFREGPLRTGDPIVALGYPLRGFLATGANVSVGNVSALAGLRDDTRHLQISAPVQPGNSGGPLLDASGHLAGILTSKLNAVRTLQATGDIPQNVNFGLKAEVVRTFLDSNGLTYRTARSDRQLTPADVVEIARPATVLIECRLAHSQPAAATEKRKNPQQKIGPPVPPPSVAASPNYGNAPCESFQKLPEGPWRVIRGVNVNHHGASVALTPGTVVVPGTAVAGADIYAALEKACR
jgi:hypothetical protein